MRTGDWVSDQGRCLTRTGGVSVGTPLPVILIILDNPFINNLASPGSSLLISCPSGGPVSRLAAAHYVLRGGYKAVAILIRQAVA